MRLGMTEDASGDKTGGKRRCIWGLLEDLTLALPVEPVNLQV